MPHRWKPLILAALLFGGTGFFPPAAGAQDKPLLVFAAASLKNVIDDINGAFAERSGLKVVASYAATSALMKQIEEGAPADVFISADEDWMNYGVQKKLVRADTRFNLAGSRLVLVAPKDSKIAEVKIAPGVDLAALAGDGRIVTADVRAVPAGKYAKAALEKLGVWGKVEPKLAMAENVRAALVLVARGEASLGIVYKTDADAEPGVKIVGTFPPNSHPPIVYPAALTASARPEAKRYLDFLRSGTALVAFEHYGFTFLVGAGP
jgi:molybdate transport system substrate-binding protein